MGRQQKKRGKKSHPKPKPKRRKLENSQNKKSRISSHSSCEKSTAKDVPAVVPPAVSSDDEGDNDSVTNFDIFIRSLGDEDAVLGGATGDAVGGGATGDAVGGGATGDAVGGGATGDAVGGGATGDAETIGGANNTGATGDPVVREQGELELLADEDPFALHFEQEFSEDEVERLRKTLAGPLQCQHSVDPVFGSVSEASYLPGRTPKVPVIRKKSLSELHVKKRLCDSWRAGVGEFGAELSVLQEKLFSIMTVYKDLLFAERTFENGEEIRKTYLLHTLNHILKTRSKILKNNTKLAQAATEGRDIEVCDQGLTRPKVLILVPFREAALRTVNLLISLLVPSGKGQVNNRKRFIEEYSEGEYLEPKVEKPASYKSMFAGNIDDCFRIGVAIKKNAINLYSKFYASDLIIASPLGLRMVIGAEGDSSRDYDFLSSLELIVVDQADVYLMQNWDHLLHLFDHTHLRPKESHDVDFSRVRSWCLSGWGKFYKQLLVFSSFLTPEVNSLFNTNSMNFAGSVKISEASYVGSISQAVVQAPHTFKRFPCSSHTELSKTRFRYFVDKVLPDFTGELMKQTCIVVPSYFDFFRLRDHMRKQEMDFVELSEYTKTADISRGRTKFFHGGAQFLLYTERVHFFRRFKIRGIRHVVFYSLPTYSEFYPELVNQLQEKAKVEGVTCTVVYSRYDSLALCRVVGSRQAQTMVKSQDDSFTFVTGVIK